MSKDISDDAHFTRAEACVAHKKALTTPEGQIVVAYLMHKFGHTRAPMFCPSRGNLGVNLTGTRTEDLIFAEGQRSVLIEIGVMLDADPAQFEQTNEAEM